MRVKYRPTPEQDWLKERYHYNPETGIFTRAQSFRRWKEGQVCGTLACGYISINAGSTVYRAHRLAWRWMTGDDPDFEIDHINTIRTDNRWCNLRRATHSENVTNAPLRKTNTTGFKGVTYDKRKDRFYARIQFNHESLWLGGHDTAEKASIAYESAAKAIHGAFRHLASTPEQPDK